jgi:hypothetical protein
MKSFTFFSFLVIVLFFQFTGCGDNNFSSFIVELPEAPKSWVHLLGEPHWRIEWFDPEGQKQVKDILPGVIAEVEIPITWTNAVAAYPWWPDYNLAPGLFKPAGALFPYDIFSNRLCLTWKAGVDTIFYYELAYANSQDIKKIPANFDWIRFRELFESDVLSGDVCKDPWLINWRNVAEKTISGSFDRRRLVPQAAETVNVHLSARCWYGTSPFSEPLLFPDGEPLVFYSIPDANTWISEEGILRCNGKILIFTPFE